MSKGDNVMKAAISNWQGSKDPFSKKIRDAVKNNWVKLRTGKSCCGHPGQVGC